MEKRLMFFGRWAERTKTGLAQPGSLNELLQIEKKLENSVTDEVITLN